MMTKKKAGDRGKLAARPGAYVIRSAEANRTGGYTKASAVARLASAARRRQARST